MKALLSFEFGARGFAIPGAGGNAAVAQLVLLHFAVFGCRQFIDELDEARDGKGGKPRPAKFGTARLR